MNRTLQAIVACGLLLAAGCATVEVKPIKVEPIHVIVDVNIRVDRQLDQFFAFDDQFNATTQPATRPAVDPVDGAQTGGQS